MRLIISFVLPIVLVSFTIRCGAQTAGRAGPKDFQSEIIETDTFTIQRLDLGAVSAGKNIFSCAVKNKKDIPLTLGLDLRTEPGLWLRNWQDQFVVHLGPGEEKRIEAPYEFLGMSDEAVLRVQFGVPSLEDSVVHIRRVFFEKKYRVGRDNRPSTVDLSEFQKYTSEHFDIYCFKKSLAEKQIADIIRQRESGFKAVSGFLNVAYAPRIRLFLFPDGVTKKKITGHTGEGWAVSNNIVEVYNETVRLDPFHEVTHLIAGELGEPPALLNEGFATYMSERLGSDALKYLGSPGTKIDEAARLHKMAGELIPLDTLFGYTDIGPEESRPGISYPEAASFVKFIIETYGIEKFRQAFGKLRNSDDHAVIAGNRESFREIYGRSVSVIALEWLKKLE